PRMSPPHSAWPRRRCSHPSSTSSLRGSSRCAPSCEPSASTCAMQPELRPAIVQDARDGRVLMLAWMDDEALRLTRETGEASLWRTVVERVRDRPDGSYVASLAEAGVERAAQKLGEEAVEAAIAATAGDGRLVSEAADVLFHLYVLLAVAGVDVAEVEDELTR